MAKEEEFKPYQEWMRQADYDFKTACSLFEAGRYIYVIFMCHLAIEKTLKGLYTQLKRNNPPKTHDLDHLCEEIKLFPPRPYQNFIDSLNELNVAVRYPEELRQFLKEYKKERTKIVLKQTKELLIWLKKQSTGQR